ncbi:Mitochondrial [Hibiscus syriacus]|uniref:Mitochondrial n=1 Tax=Hibiscus syriacus TaxID=106335 RepID=A0A6A3BCX3_HIBSY|nr:Mitochondrial [Hibiscus syriacus]
MEEKVVNSNVRSPLPSLVARGSNEFRVSDNSSLPPRKGHRRSSSDVPLAAMLDRSVSGIEGSFGAVESIQSVKRELEWKKDCGVGDNTWNSSGTEVKDLDSKANGTKTYDDESSDNEVDSRVNKHPISVHGMSVVSNEKRGGVNKRMAAGDITPTVRHYISVSMDDYIGSMQFDEDDSSFDKSWQSSLLSPKLFESTISFTWRVLVLESLFLEMLSAKGFETKKGQSMLLSIGEVFEDKTVSVGGFTVTSWAGGQDHLQAKNLFVCLDLNWQVVAGEESKEVEIQNQREVRVLEAVYPRPSAIPTNPSVSADIGNCYYDDQLTPQIPVTPIEDEDAAIETLLNSQPQMLPPGILHNLHCSMPSVSSASAEKPDAGMVVNVEPGVAAAAFAVINQSNEPGNMIDPDLLVKILSNPRLIEKLVTDHGAASGAQSLTEMPSPLVPSLDPPHLYIWRSILSSVKRVGVGPLNKQSPIPSVHPVTASPAAGLPRRRMNGANCAYHMIRQPSRTVAICPRGTECKENENGWRNKQLEMTKGEDVEFLSKVKIEFNALTPRIASCMEFLAQCNARQAKESNPPATPGQAPYGRSPSPNHSYFRQRSEEVFDANIDSCSNRTEHDPRKRQFLETEQMFRDAGEKWPVIIPEEELHQSFPGSKVWAFSLLVASFVGRGILSNNWPKVKLFKLQIPFEMEGVSVADANLVVYLHPHKCRNVSQAILRDLGSWLFKGNLTAINSNKLFHSYIGYVIMNFTCNGVDDDGDDNSKLFNEIFDGVLLAYDVHIPDKKAKILSGVHPYFDLKLKANLLLFSPKPDMIIEGKVVKLCQESIHAIVLGFSSAIITAENMGGEFKIEM